MATHGLFTEGTGMLESPLLQGVAISDSVPLPGVERALKAGRLVVVDTAESIAATLVARYGLIHNADLRQGLIRDRSHLPV
ncbi:hypothetical protein D3C80_1778350 [compost metagenome]